MQGTRTRRLDAAWQLAAMLTRSVTTRIATVSRIATSASALLEKSRSRMVSVLSILLDGAPRVKVYLSLCLSQVRPWPRNSYAPGLSFPVS